MICIPAARNFPEASSAWQRFLVSSNRIYNRLHAGARGDTKDEPWYGKKVHERKGDPLLSYMDHARDVDEHGLEPVIREEPGFVALTGDFIINGTLSFGPSGFGPGTNFTMQGINPNRPPGVMMKGPEARLVDVTDTRFGDTFSVPQEHMGKPIPNATPAVIAELALIYLEGLIQEAALRCP